MKILTVKKLQDRFRGKICTVLTRSVAKSSFTDPQFSDFFTGVVDEIDDDGVFTTHTLTGCKNFFNMNDIVGIMEEQVVNEGSPEYQKIVTDISEQMKKVPKNEDTNNESFINIDELSEIAGGTSKGTQ